VKEVGGGISATTQRRRRMPADEGTGEATISEGTAGAMDVTHYRGYD
jgi:hypothetical protein